MATGQKFGGLAVGSERTVSIGVFVLMRISEPRINRAPMPAKGMNPNTPAITFRLRARSPTTST